jgi:hypothetical protein
MTPSDRVPGVQYDYGHSIKISIFSTPGAPPPRAFFYRNYSTNPITSLQKRGESSTTTTMTIRNRMYATMRALFLIAPLLGSFPSLVEAKGNDNNNRSPSASFSPRDITTREPSGSTRNDGLSRDDEGDDIYSERSQGRLDDEDLDLDIEDDDFEFELPNFFGANSDVDPDVDPDDRNINRPSNTDTDSNIKRPSNTDTDRNTKRPSNVDPDDRNINRSSKTDTDSNTKRPSNADADRNINRSSKTDTDRNINRTSNTDADRNIKRPSNTDTDRNIKRSSNTDRRPSTDRRPNTDTDTRISKRLPIREETEAPLSDKHVLYDAYNQLHTLAQVSIPLCSCPGITDVYTVLNLYFSLPLIRRNSTSLSILLQ